MRTSASLGTRTRRRPTRTRSRSIPATRAPRAASRSRTSACDGAAPSRRGDDETAGVRARVDRRRRLGDVPLPLHGGRHGGFVLRRADRAQLVIETEARGAFDLARTVGDQPQTAERVLAVAG